MAWVVEKRPDVIEGYIPGTGVLKGIPLERLGPLRRKMTRELFAEPAFRREYLFVRNAPYGSVDRAIFVERRFWEDRLRRNGYEAIPVDELGLWPPRTVVSDRRR
jgi:hypothetical protein